MLTKRGRTVRNIGVGLIGLLIWEAGSAQAEAPIVEKVVVQPVKAKTIDFPLEAWSPATAKEYGKYAIQEYGWDDAQFECLKALWTKESNWRWKAKSPTNDYGIPQRNMPDNTQEELTKFLSDPIGQISWGLSYIEHRYSNPCSAKRHSDLKGWY